MGSRAEFPPEYTTRLGRREPGTYRLEIAAGEKRAAKEVVIPEGVDKIELHVDLDESR